jgi:hypothetical protein
MKLEGMGKETIAKKLNGEAPWTPPSKERNGGATAGWRGSYVQKILQNRAVIGEYQPYTGRLGDRSLADNLRDCIAPLLGISPALNILIFPP